MDECFACKTPASDYYELSYGLRSDRENITTVVCDACASDFRDIRWIDIEAAPRQKEEISD